MQKDKKLNEEKLQLQKIYQELHNENLERKLKIEHIKRENQSELDKFFLKKNDEEQYDYFEKLDNVDKLTLPLGHEERLEKYKEYMSQLNNKIEKNVGIYKNYHNRDHSVNLVYDNQNKILKDDFMLENQTSNYNLKKIKLTKLIFCLY